MCNWIKGLYGVIRESDIDTVITVMEGDCSNTRALAEILSYKGVADSAVSPFPTTGTGDTCPGDREAGLPLQSIRRASAQQTKAFGR